MKGVDLDATLDLFRELLQYSDYKEPIDKRKALETGAAVMRFVRGQADLLDS